MWSRRWPRTALALLTVGDLSIGCRYLTFAVLHLVLHASHLAGMPARDAIGLVTALALDVAFPALVLLTAGRAKRPV